MVLTDTSNETQATLFSNLLLVVRKAALSLSNDRQIVSLQENGDVNRHIYGIQFSDFVYFCMSQGLLDPKSLEMIQNRHTLDEVVMTPSYILRDTW